MIKNVIFDLDGTLLDTMNDMLLALNLAEEHVFGKKRLHNFKRGDGIFLYGNGQNVLVKRALDMMRIYDEAKGQEFKDSFFQLYEEKSNTKTTVYPGIIETLLALKERHIRCFIVSNKPIRILTRAVKKYFTDGLIVDFVGNEEGLYLKPDARALSPLVEKYDLKISESLYVGDSLVDYEFAMNTKMKLCLVTYGYELKNNIHVLKNCYKVKDAFDIIEVVDQLNSFE